MAAAPTPTFTERYPKVVRRGKTNFVYPNTNRVVSAKIAECIRAAGVPPMYSTMWVNATNAKEPVRVVALDSKGRKQYFYTKQFRESRQQDKSRRMERFAALSGRLREQLKRDFASLSSSLSPTRNQVMAFMIRIMDQTNIRVGNKKYFDQNGTCGLTTLQRKHVRFLGPDELQFCFKGKHNVPHCTTLRDPEAVQFVKRLFAASQSQWVFTFPDTGVRVTAEDLNEYIQKAMGSREFTCKDFRTFNANRVFLERLSKRLKGCPPKQRQQRQRQSWRESLRETAAEMNHTTSVCKKNYLLPKVIEFSTNLFKRTLK